MAPNNPLRPGQNSSSGVTHPNLRRLSHLSTKVIAVVWRLITRPLTLLIVSLLALTTASTGLALPQLPSQLNDDSAAVSRWLLSTGAEYGWFGPTLRGLGLFNVLHSVLLRFLLTTIGLILFLQCAELIGRAILLYRLQRYVEAARSDYNRPIPLRSYTSLFRHRTTVGEHFDTFTTALVDRMLHMFDRTTRLSAPVRDINATNEVDDQTATTVTAQLVDNGDDHCYGRHQTPSNDASILNRPELRIVGVNDAVSAYLRPLLPAGLLLALFATWLITTFGWKMTTPLMVPGDSYSSVHNVIVDYQLPSEDLEDNNLDLAAPRVTIARGPTTMQSIITTFGNAYLGNINFQTMPASPGLLVRTEDGSEQLSRPGQTTRVAAIGLAFPAEGSEESVLIPDALAGLRVVRQPDGGDTFVVETYHSAIVQPVQRFEFTSRTMILISAGSTSIDLEFLPAPAIYVTARYVPGTWLLWPAAILCLLGLFGLVRRPEFIVVQAYAWSPTHTLVILQSNLDRLMEKFVGEIDREDAADQSGNGANPMDEQRPDGQRPSPDITKTA